MTITYSGTTAGATSQNPPVLMASAIGGKIVNAPGLQGAKLWFYTSTNAATDVAIGQATSFTDGKKLGMTNGDVLLGVYSTDSSSTNAFLYLGVVCGVSTSGVALSSAFISSTAV